MRAAAVALLAVCASVLAPHAQQPIRVGTNFVRVDVYPTKDGRVVEGLTPADFELLEDGVPQKIDTFEHVRPVFGPYTARTQPTSQRDMLQAVANPRNRIFLIFLDAPWVDFESAHAINGPLAEFLRNDLADDDLVGIMTPAMSAKQITFGKRTEVLEGGLKSLWKWGRRDKDLDPELDRREIQYGLCYPGSAGGDVAAKMVARRRERVTLEALQDAVKYLHSIREERKAIVTVSHGWPLYREDLDMLRKHGNETPPGVDKIRVGPTGKLTLEDHRTMVNGLSPSECLADRTYLAQIDDEKFLREIIEDANRANATFYTIDPGGLSVRAPDRNGALRTLAENTDGISVMNTNDLHAGINRIVADMSSYYLLGYYPTNSNPDGRFRSITVKTKRADILVRARKGYRAPTREETIAATRTSAPPVNADAAAVQAAIARIPVLRPDTRFHVHAAASIGAGAAVWVAGELQSGGRPDEFLEGSKARIEAVGEDISVNAEVTLKPAERTFLAKLDLPSAPKKMLDVRVRLESDSAVSAPLTGAVRLELEPFVPQPMLFRRGVTTGNRLAPAADMRFSRTERVKIEIPIGAVEGAPVGGRVLDRGGLPTQVPVVMSERTDDTRQHWIVADVNLAALSPADYAVEVKLTREKQEIRVLTPIRVVR
ncbi:MAG TPA: VWA domain-containing protein [Vicinamibacterales bacterium]|jgi:VWFA-related protein